MSSVERMFREEMSRLGLRKRCNSGIIAHGKRKRVARDKDED